MHTRIFVLDTRMHARMHARTHTHTHNLKVQINLNIEKIAFKVVQMKCLAMHITKQRLRFDIFTAIHLLNIFMEHDLFLIS